jgi:tripartite-type tricarboxylate transporter receptor subunit TctC
VAGAAAGAAAEFENSLGDLFMTDRNRRFALQAGAAGAAALAMPWVHAQNAWPNKPVTVIVPFPPGGGTDAFARPLFATMGKNLGRQFLIDNKGGAGGTLGASVAAKAAPDGYTFLMGAVHHTIAPSMYPKLDYNFENDFIPVGLVASVPQVVVVNPSRIQANNLNEFIALLRKNPGKFNYGSAGNGTSHHLAGELFKLQTKTFITHIPYRGSGPALQDLLAGQVEMMFDGLASSANHIKGGRLRGIAVASEKRAPGFADLPTAREAGLADYQVATWYGIFANKGTPPEIVSTMQNEMRKALASDEIKTAWNNLGAETPNLWAEAFGGFVRGEVKRWATVVKSSGAKLDA